MKKTGTFLLFFLILFVTPLIAQDFDLKWSERMIYDNRKDGFFKEFLGSTENYVFVLNNNLALRQKKASKQLNLIAYSKASMQKKGMLRLVNRKDKGRMNDLDGMSYVDMFILDGMIHVFWLKETKSSSTIFAESYNENLEQIRGLKKVYHVDYKVTSGRLFKRSSAFALAGKGENKNILIGSEVPSEKGDDIAIKYAVVNSELEEVSDGEVDLPIEKTGKFYGLTSSYSFERDGNLYIKSYASVPKEDRKSLKKGEHSSFSILSVVDTDADEITSFPMKYIDKNIYDFDYIIGDKGVKIYGFFNDINKDPFGYVTHGIFSSTIGSKSHEMSEPNFSYFDKALFDALFKNDAEENKISKKKKKKKKKGNDAAPSDAYLDSRYVIESASVDDKNNIVLFCAKMYNYSVTTCTTSSSGGTTCTTRYYCQKSNVTTFKLNDGGEIVWASNVDRSKTYSGTSIMDVRVIEDKQNYYVVYGSTFDLDASKKNRRSSKSKTELRDKFEYAVISKADGEATKKEFVVNQPGTKKADRKGVNPVAITVIDNKFYVNSTKITFKPALTAGLCVASVACFPILYYIALSPNMRKGKGNLGTLEVVE